ncbi:Uncharacterised protein [Mycoplasmopsis gallopavonis]|uniref:Uncharacterized protein n=1 Tax=Mycoplasmopsis gallopavonis TaxID=76629 RepID=A0A449AZD5_9BACT|nr:Uncharacterised protein [Mycoplasmopsis gallopavonis]
MYISNKVKGIKKSFQLGNSGSTYWFTFLSNIFMAITLLFYPTAQNSLRAQKFYFASMVYIIIVASAYWTGVFMVPTTYTNLFYDQKVKSIIMHIVAPILGLATLYYERKRIQISNPSIWSFAIYPALYLILLIVPTYVLGYKFMEFGKTTQADGTIIYPSELSRGIVIYQLVSFNHPLGYPGDLIFIKVVLNILMISLAFISAPAIGFLLRQILRIRRPGQEEMPKLYFINPDTKYIKAMLKFTNRLSKYSLESANEIRERLFPKKDSNKKIQNYYQKAMETIQKLSKNKNKETNENNDMN